MSKVSIKLQGGLCNYLFQIAAAYSYAKKTNKECVFSINDAITVHKHINTYTDNILRNVNFVDNVKFNGFKLYNEPYFSYTEIPKIDGDVYLQGYFQSEKYFKEYESEIRSIFQISNNLYETVSKFVLNKFNVDIVKDDTCSIHVRRGDYLKLPDNHPQQGTHYYMKAMKTIGIDKKFLVFSDDIQWCKDNFPELDNMIFVEGLKDYEDLYLMSLSKHNIICNSSFSWWAAWLNKNTSKKVIAPKKWFGVAYAHFNTKDLYCNDWTLF